MRFYTKIIEDDVILVYSHNEQLLTFHPEILGPIKMSTQEFFKGLNIRKKIAKESNEEIHIQQYCIPFNKQPEPEMAAYGY